jgi:hypothetical protein
MLGRIQRHCTNAVHLKPPRSSYWGLGLPVIASRLGITSETVAKAVAWGSGREPAANAAMARGVPPSSRPHRTPALASSREDDRPWAHPDTLPPRRGMDAYPEFSRHTQGLEAVEQVPRPRPYLARPPPERDTCAGCPRAHLQYARLRLEPMKGWV